MKLYFTNDFLHSLTNIRLSSYNTKKHHTEKTHSITKHGLTMSFKSDLALLRIGTEAIQAAKP